ncbi:trypsin-like [Bicyclus anynana]|uniref:Trypsin-like n=1 Tax=Bicyclus anynana TaxID=110368 RepID=A0A6J1NUQ0_BICAN|nr:trypsin-like [Bicyclus anynana]
MTRFTDILRFLIFVIVISACNGENINDDNSDDGKDDSMDIADPPDPPTSNVSLCTRRKNTQMHEIRAASAKQFPFIVAILNARNDYICAGSIVSNGIILTSAQCAESAKYVLINATKDKKNESTESVHVIRTEHFPTYKGPTSKMDVAVLYTDKLNNTLASKINLSNHTFSRNLNEIEAIGFGLNADVGQVKELQYVGLDARIADEELIFGFIDCIDTKVNTCFKDKGGPLIVNNELVGIITNGQDECTSEIMSTYSINKLMVTAMPIYTFKSWLDEKIAKHPQLGVETLQSYPIKPAVRMQKVHLTKRNSGAIYKAVPLYYMLMLFLNLC